MMLFFYTILTLLFVGLSFFFSASETALISANRYSLETLSRKKKRGAVLALRLLDQTEKYLGVILIGNNVSNISATAFITFLAAVYYHAGARTLLLVTLTQTMLFLIFCEILPKLISRKYAEFLIRYFSLPLLFFSKIFSFVSWIITLAGSLTKLFLKPEDTYVNKKKARTEIDLLFRMGEEAGIIDQTYKLYITEILNLHNRQVNQIMTPVVEMVSVEKKQSIRSVIKLLEKTKFSRVPVYEERVDNITGFIHYRDLLSCSEQAKEAGDVARAAEYVPATKKIHTLYKDMQKRNSHLVFVVNEYGGVTGLVTREDIAEEIVGEIRGGLHSGEQLIIHKGDDVYSVAGELDIDYFARLFNLTIPKHAFETVAGFVLYQFDRVPEAGEQITAEDLVLTVEEATAREVKRIIVQRKTKPRGTKAVKSNNPLTQ